jgi:alkylated DNA repair dioxygenase AlkB
MNLFSDSKQNLLPCDGELFKIENLIPPKEAKQIYEQLLKEINWQQYQIRMFGKMIDQPRLTAWYGEENIAYSYSGLNLKALPFTPLLENLRTKIEENYQANFNSVLLNLYRNEKDSMGWHADDEKELGLTPIIASLSFGSTRKFLLKHKNDKALKVELYLTPGSLVIMKGSMQHHWLHAIPKASITCGPRINLTFRSIIPKKVKNGFISQN